MILFQENTWPVDVVKFLEAHIEYLHESNDTNIEKSFSDELYNIVSHFSLQGYHCTRLTEKEISNIIKNGMGSPNKAMLVNRIDALLSDGLIDLEISEKLKSQNAADHQSRKNQLWFCFYKPYKSGQSGIERPLRFWGGEALFACHEGDLLVDPILKKIGTSAIVKATIPIKNLENFDYLCKSFCRYFLKNRRKKTGPCEFESYTKEILLSKQILGITKHPEREFISLTKCNTWRPNL